MNIVSVTATFAKENIGTALDVLQAFKSQTDENFNPLDYQIYTDPNLPTKIFIYQVWKNLQAFDAYRNSNAFAKMGKDLAPLMTSAPQTVIFDATQIS